MVKNRIAAAIAVADSLFAANHSLCKVALSEVTYSTFQLIASPVIGTLHLSDLGSNSILLHLSGHVSFFELSSSMVT